MRDQYINSGQGFLVVYSITNRESFDAIPDMRDKILMVKDEDDTFPMVLIGNKCDLEKSREVPHAEGAELAKKWNIPFFETSAKARINVEEAFITVVREIRKRERNRSKSGGNMPVRPTQSSGSGSNDAVRKSSSSFCIIL
jgi:GTPase KRas